MSFVRVHPSVVSFWTIVRFIATTRNGEITTHQQKEEKKKICNNFDVKLLSIFNIKLHSCWVIWLLNKYMVMAMPNVHYLFGGFLIIFRFFYFLVVFAAGLKYAYRQAVPDFRTRSMQLYCQKNKGWWMVVAFFFSFFVNSVDIRPYHIHYECNCHVIWLFIVSFFFSLEFASERDSTRLDVDAFLIGHRWIARDRVGRWRKKRRNNDWMRNARQ